MLFNEYNFMYCSSVEVATKNIVAIPKTLCTKNTDVTNAKFKPHELKSLHLSYNK